MQPPPRRRHELAMRQDSTSHKRGFRIGSRWCPFDYLGGHGKIENSTTVLRPTTWLPFCFCMKIQYVPYNMPMVWVWFYSGLYSLSRRTSYRQISWSLEAAWLGVIMSVTLCNLAGNCCRGAYQISERLEKTKPDSRGFQISRDIVVRSPSV